MVEPVHLGGIGEHAARLVQDDGVVFPAVPVAEHDFHELVGPVVAEHHVLDGLRAEVGRLGVVERGDDVPGGPAADHVVKGREMRAT